MFQLRDYQADIIDRTRAALRTSSSVLIQSATGSGKTNLATYMIGRAAERGRRAWFICHRDFLLTQTSATFNQIGVPHGFIAAGRKASPETPVQIASIDTLRRRLAAGLQPPDLIVWDEAHHVAAQSWMAVRRWCDADRNVRAGSSARPAAHIGLSATPARLDGRGLDGAFGAMVRGPSTAWLIERGFLSGYRAFAPSAPQLAGVHLRAGDYARGELAAVMDTDQIAGNIVGNYKERANGKRAIYFAVSVEHSKHLAESFNAAGVAARHLDASSSAVERRDAAVGLSTGELYVLTNVDLFGEGFDLSSQAGQDVSVEVVGLCRPTQSLALHLQQIGRALRPKPEPAIILDHAGNCMRHGLPDDEREWTLAGRTRMGSPRPEPVASISQCAECFAVFSPREACPYCGVVCEVSPREVTEVAVDLAEIDRVRLQLQRRLEQSRAETYEDLVALGIQRGYKNPYGWAKHLSDARSKKHVGHKAVGWESMLGR